MLENVHSWLVNHPIWQSFIINAVVGIALLLMAAYWKLIVAFSQIPPQRLGTWLRKARLSATVSKLASHRRANEHPRYALRMFVVRFVPIFAYLGMILMFVSFQVLLVLVPTEPLIVNDPPRAIQIIIHSLLETRAGQMLWCFLPTSLIIFYSFSVLRFAEEYSQFERTESKLVNKINAFKVKLGEPLESTTNAQPINLILREAVADEAGQSENRTYRQGARVRHPKYGEGIIFRTEGTGGAAKLTVQFEKHGIKKLVSKFAELERL